MFGEEGWRARACVFACVCTHTVVLVWVCLQQHPLSVLVPVSISGGVSAIMSVNPIAGNCSAEELANMSVIELQTLKVSQLVWL